MEKIQNPSYKIRKKEIKFVILPLFTYKKTQMKKLIGLLLIASIMFATSCTENTRAKKYGGTMTVDLPKGMKLENVTFKDDEIWYLMRPMRPGENPETHSFHEDSKYGLMQGTVNLVESN